LRSPGLASPGLRKLSPGHPGLLSPGLASPGLRKLSPGHPGPFSFCVTLARVEYSSPLNQSGFADSACICELAGDTLHWCAARPGSKERLGQFPSEYDPNYVCLTFRRS